MELGRHLVHELGFEDGVDTLGRWMAHHLAELIDEAENGPTAENRSEAHKDAVDTIVRIWEHRASLPGKAYPLAPYGDVLKVLNSLRPDSNPFPYFQWRGGSRREQLAAVLFDDFSRLIIALLLTKLPSEEKPAELDSAAAVALDETELHILTALHQWGELFKPTVESTSRRRKGKKTSDAEVNLDESAIDLIDSITATLDALRDELQGSGREDRIVIVVD